MSLRVEPITGEALRAKLPRLAALRIRVFRDWPYLYDGSEDYERRYLATYAASPGSVIVGAFEGERAVGAATALPLAHETDDVTAPFRARGLDPDRIFYFGAEARARGFACLALQTRIELVENHRAFGRMGFVKTAETAHPGFARPTSFTMRATVQERRRSTASAAPSAGEQKPGEAEPEQPHRRRLRRRHEP